MASVSIIFMKKRFSFGFYINIASRIRCAVLMQQIRVDHSGLGITVRMYLIAINVIDGENYVHIFTSIVI